MAHPRSPCPRASVSMEPMSQLRSKSQGCRYLTRWRWRRIMMGRQRVDQASLFYEFRLEDRIPKTHRLRRINAFLAGVLADLYEQLQPYYSELGRPSIDPELMIRMRID